MKRKSASLLLAIIMLLSMLPFSAFADQGDYILHTAVNGQNEDGHECVADNRYGLRNVGHYKYCRICGEQMGSTQPHTFENSVCTICGIAEPDHQCVANYFGYSGNENGHWRNCSICHQQMEDAQPHTYADGRCTVCNVVDPNHTCIYVDGRCTICHKVDPNHQCVASDQYYGYNENSHWKCCRICSKQLEDVQPHAYVDGRCTACGASDPNHECVASDWYSWNENGHWKNCRLCSKQIGDVQPHTYTDGRCTVCNAVDPNHTCIYVDGRCTICYKVDPNHECVAGNWYTWDKNGHWKCCRICNKPLEDAQPHTYADGRCTVCNAVDPNHTCIYVDGSCTICHEVDPNHQCVASDQYYGYNENSHWKQCHICYKQLEDAQPHTYAHEGCTVCGKYSPNHVHSYRWFGESQWCRLCGKENVETRHTCNFVNHICEKCGLLDPTLTPASIVVGNNQNKQMTVSLTFADESSLDLTIIYMDARKGDPGLCAGMIYTKESVILGSSYWLMWNTAEKYTIGYKANSDEAVVGNFDADASWLKIQNIADRHGMLMDSFSYENGMWTVTGKAYDGQDAVMTLNDNLTVLNYTIGEDELVKTSGIVTVSDAKAKPGKTVTVKVDLSANKGISNMRLQMSYPEGFTLESIQKGDALSTLFFTPPGKLTANPVNFLWDGREADTSEGCILELTFRIADTVAVGEYSISLSYQKDDVLDGSLEGIDLALQSGTVSVVEFTRGDIDGDGVIGMKDLGALRKYFAGGYDTGNFVMEAADLDGDGVVTMKDLGVLRRYLAGGYDINLGE